MFAHGTGNVYRETVAQMGKDGWLTLNWPKEYGGQDRTPMDSLIFTDEAATAGAGPLFGDQERSGALEALLTVAFVLGGAALAWICFGRVFGVSPGKAAGTVATLVPAGRAAKVVRR